MTTIPSEASGDIQAAAAAPPALPQLPEWPLVGQRLLPNVTSYLGRIYSVIPGFRSLTLDLHVPDGEGPFPVATYASGGGFMINSTVMGEWQPLLAAGYAVASITYRLRGEVQHPGSVDDIVAAATWVRQHAAEFDLDASRIIGTASSAGAYLTDYAALTRDAAGNPWQTGSEPLFAAVVSFYAVTDFAALGEDEHDEVLEPAGTPSSTETQYLGYIPSQRPVDAAAAALGAHARSDAPPFLILHGDDDRRVGVGQALRFAEALTAAGATPTVVIVPGADHGTPEFTSPEVVAAVTGFLATTLK
jgi:acetyl esterase/lipase